MEGEITPEKLHQPLRRQETEALIEELERRKAVIELLKDYDKILGILASDLLEINLTAYRVGTAVYTRFGDSKETRDMIRIAIEEAIMKRREALLVGENPNLENSVNFTISRPVVDVVDEPTDE